ncbi:MAG TPA: hypothetical protein VEJ44_00155 [Acidimicrobiales bacterium]|nr:hypothetical protein [Acidimicrobiales bacterium]
MTAIGVACALALIAAAPAGATSPPPGLSKLQKYLQSTPKATYQATYIVKNSSSGTQTMVVAQTPNKSYFKTGSGAVISTGKKTYYCSATSGTTSCYAEAGAGTGSSLTQLLSPAVIGAEVSAYANEYASHIPGVSVSSSSKTIAGLPSTCVTAKAHGQTGTWCVSNKGVLTSVTSTGTSITLKSFSSSVPSSLFTVPAGSVHQIPSIPGGGSIPDIPT